MSEKKRIGFNETCELIELKHNYDSEDKFSKAENNPQRLSETWSSLSKELNNIIQQELFTGSVARNKYNQLLSKYKTERQKTLQSGGEATSWLYWEVFNNSITRKNKFDMENVTELGSGEEVINHTSENIVEEKSNKKTIIKSYKQLKTELMESFLTVNKTKLEEKIKLKKSEKKLKKRIKKMNKIIKSNKKTLDEILKHLKKEDK